MGMHGKQDWRGDKGNAGLFLQFTAQGCDSGFAPFDATTGKMGMSGTRILVQSTAGNTASNQGGSGPVNDQAKAANHHGTVPSTTTLTAVSAAPPTPSDVTRPRTTTSAIARKATKR